MKEKFLFSVSRIDKQSPQRGGLTEEEFELVCGLLPDLEVMYGSMFNLKLMDSDDERIPRILGALEEAGVDVMDSGPNSPLKFSLVRFRKYECEELLESEFAIPQMSKILGEEHPDYIRDEHGIPQLKAALRPYKQRYGRVENSIGPITLVRSEVKELLESANLKGLRFIEPKLAGRHVVSSEERAWVLWSDIVMPAMRNVCYDDLGNKFQYDKESMYPHGCFQFGGYVAPSEPFYSRVDVEAVRGVDIALTFERFGNANYLSPSVVMSRRMCRFFVEELGERFGGTPVHIDANSCVPWTGPYPDMLAHKNLRPDWLARFDR